MNRIRLLVIPCVAALAVAAVGCGNYTRPVAAEPTPASPAERHFQALWLATQDVLHDYQFTIDRRDRRAGIITTQPLVGMQFFEPWRKDAVTPYALWDSSLKTLHRTVTVRIMPTSNQAEPYEPIVEVAVSKPDAPPREIHSTGEAYSMFVLPGGEHEEERHGILGYTYQPPGQEDRATTQPSMGQDVDLAKRLTKEIATKALRRLAEGK